MANNDLQQLYELRSLIREEQSIVSYNKRVNQNLVSAVNSMIPEQVSRLNNAYNNYVNIKEKQKKKRKIIDIFKPALLQILVVGVLSVLALIFSPNVPKTLFYIFCTAGWVSLYCLPSGIKNNVRFIICFILPFAFAIFALCLASDAGVFWGWIGGLLVFLIWPISNFFMLKPLIWLSIVSVVTIGIVFFLIKNNCNEKNDEELETEANNNSSVQIAYQNYERVNEEYQKAYNIQYAKIKDKYIKMLKPDTYSAKKKALQSLLPANLQTLDMVNKIIWCIEQKYAYDVVSARNWYRDQEFNEKIRDQIEAVTKRLNDLERLQKEAIQKADAQHQEIIEAYERTGVMIEEQARNISSQIDKEAGYISQSVNSASRSVSQSVDAVNRSTKY